MSAYGDKLSAVGLNPDNPDGMYQQLQQWFSDPVGFKNAQKGWHGTKDALIWWEDPPGDAGLGWPFHWGNWMKAGPTNEAQTRAIFQIPDGTDTDTFMRNLYKVPNSIPKWHMRVESWEGGGIGDWAANAVASAGKEIGHATSEIADDVGKVGNLIKKIPVVGSPIVSIFDGAYKAASAPFHALGDVVSGHADKAFNDFMKDNKTGLDEVGPYAKMVCSCVPGIGSAIGGAIGCGMALADGQPLDKAFIAGIAGAIPGGPLVQAAFTAGTTIIDDAVTHKKIDAGSLTGAALQAAGSLVPGIGDAVGGALGGALGNALGGINAQVPKAVSDAIKTGMAVGTAAQEQANQATQLLSTLPGKLTQTGIDLSKTLPEVGAARDMVAGLSNSTTSVTQAIGMSWGFGANPPAVSSTTGVAGFDIGAGLLSHEIKPFHFHTIRNSLSPIDQRGFDMAVNLKVGLVAHPTPANLSPAARAGHAITMGMQGGNSESNAAVMSAVAQHPGGVVGAKVALKRIARKGEGWFTRLLRGIGLKND